MTIVLPPETPAVPPSDTGPVTSAGMRLYDRLAPVATYDGENGNIVRAMAEVLAEPQELVDELFRDSDTHLAGQKLLDPDSTRPEMLPWLSRFAGVDLLPSDTVDQQRTRIKAAAGFHRGTPRAIIEDVQQALDLATPRSVMLIERDGGSMWSLTVGTRATETPDPAVVAQAIARQKPAGFIASGYQLTGWTLLEMEATRRGHRETVDDVDTYVPDPVFKTVADVEAAFATVALVEVGP